MEKKEKIGYKFLDDETEVVIVAESLKDAKIVMNKLNEEHCNGYKYLGTVFVYI